MFSKWEILGFLFTMPNDSIVEMQNKDVVNMQKKTILFFLSGVKQFKRSSSFKLSISPTFYARLFCKKVVR